MPAVAQRNREASRSRNVLPMPASRRDGSHRTVSRARRNRRQSSCASSPSFAARNARPATSMLQLPFAVNNLLHNAPSFFAFSPSFVDTSTLSPAGAVLVDEVGLAHPIALAGNDVDFFRIGDIRFRRREADRVVTDARQRFVRSAELQHIRVELLRRFLDRNIDERTERLSGTQLATVAGHRCRHRIMIDGNGDADESGGVLDGQFAVAGRRRPFIGVAQRIFRGQFRGIRGGLATTAANMRITPPPPEKCKAEWRCRDGCRCLCA